MTRRQVTRRQLLAAAGVASSGLLAGCASSGSTPPDSTTTASADTEDATRTTTATTTRRYTPSAACSMFNYDAENTGYAADQTAPTDGVNKQWRQSGVSGYASPVVHDGTVFAAGDRETRAIDLETGDVDWTVGVGEATPVVTPEALFTGSRGTLAAFDHDGGEIWRTDWTAGGGVSPKLFALTLADDTLYFNTRAGVTRAVDATNGKLRWKYPAEGSLDPSASAPVAVTDDTVVVSTPAQVVALDREDGAERWTESKGERVDKSSASVASTTNSGPVVDGDTVYVGGPDGVVRALALADGSETWTVTADGQVNSTPAVADGTVYVGSRDSTLYAIDAASGDVQWTTSLSWIVDSHPTVAGETVLAMDSASTVYGLATDGGTKRWQYQFEDTWAYSSPVVADGTVLFTTSHGLLVALD